MLLYKIQTKLRNRVDETTSRTCTVNHTSKERVFIIQNDGWWKSWPRETLMHVIKCELKQPEEILFAPAVSFKVHIICRNWIELMYKKSIVFYIIYFGMLYMFSGFSNPYNTLLLRLHHLSDSEINITYREFSMGRSRSTNVYPYTSRTGEVSRNDPL